MAKLLNLDQIFEIINISFQLTQILYLYKDLAYSTMYNIMKFKKNYFNRFKTIIYNCFNKIITRLQIVVKYSFCFYQKI